MMALPFAEAVARRTDYDLELVNSVLARNGIIPDPAPPPARPLRLSRIAFQGTKTLSEVKSPFSFEWSKLTNGLWGIATEDNFAGKSSILQIILWALRGSPKSLTPVVRHWLEHVEVDFHLDGRNIGVHFDITDGVPSGQVAIEGEVQPLLFSGDESFVAVMQDVMMRRLGLEPIASSQARGVEKDVARYDDGWVTFTGAFLSDSESDAIIGEQIGTNLTQKLLQVFLGLPWATTHFQARAQRRVLESEAQQLKRKLASLGGRTVEQMEKELDEVSHQIEDEGARSETTAKILAAERSFNNLQDRAVAARDRLHELQELVGETKESRIRAERAVLDLSEETRASAFFKQLDPVECPRCSTSIGDDRRERESAERCCSVCNSIVAEPDIDGLDSQRTDAERRQDEARKQEANAEKATTDAQKRLEIILQERASAAGRLNELSRLGTAVDLQILEKRAERLGGMLEIARAVLGADSIESNSLAIVCAAEAEAELRTKDAAEVILDRVSAEITRLARLFGMKHVDNITLDRAAHVKVTAGGTITPFTRLAPGEQLRLRIAAVLALIRMAKEFGAGRHPGLFLIDSPKNEEMSDADFAELLKAIVAAANDVGDVQIFVAIRGVGNARAGITSERLKTAGRGKYLW
jgi:hypothetical protein